MSAITSTLIPAIKNRPKKIDARTHGIIDYCYAAFFLTLGFVWLKGNKRAAAAALTTGSLVLVQSLLTDYPLGAKPLLSFESHGHIDGVMASTAWALPNVFGFSETGAANVFRSSSMIEGIVAGLTDFSSQRARAQRALAKLSE